MWGLLNSADSALLLGTSVLVVALAGMMFVTRNIDWYAFSLPKMKASKEVTTDDGTILKLSWFTGLALAVLFYVTCYLAVFVDLGHALPPGAGMGNAKP